LMAPALALAVLVAAVVSYENLVVSEWLCVRPSCRTVPMLLYRGGAGPPPMRSALASASSLVSLTLAVGVLLFALAKRPSRPR
jgi:ABC-type spermidine/putrescine transport system permease subunit II